MEETDIRVERKAELTDQDEHDLYGWGKDIDMYDVWHLGFEYLPAEHHFVCYAGDRAAAHVGLLRMVLELADGPLRLAGIKSVITVPEFRQQGHASRALTAAREFFAGTLDVDHGLLFCKESLLPFYGRLGWQHAPTPLLVLHPQEGKKPWPRQIMNYPVSERLWPTGTIDLDAKPF